MDALPIHSFLESEHPDVLRTIGLRVGIIRIGMKEKKKLHDMESASVDIKMDVALFKIRRDRFPDLDLRMHLLYLAPRRIADTPAVNMRRNKQRLLEAPV